MPIHGTKLSSAHVQDRVEQGWSTGYTKLSRTLCIQEQNKAGEVEVLAYTKARQYK